MTPKSGQVVIGFATSAGDTADDGNGDMSPYATALSKWLKVKDDIRNILGKVSIDVSEHYKQNPIYRANLASSVYLSKINIIHKPERVEPKVEIVEKIEQNKPIQSVVPKLDNSKWISPTKNICESNGGKLNKQGVCKANWENARKICRISGGVLPSEEILKRTIINCGGTPSDESGSKQTKNNKNNKNYQFCMKNKGFYLDMYWISLISANKRTAWHIDIEQGFVNAHPPTYNKVSIHCFTK